MKNLLDQSAIFKTKAYDIYVSRFLKEKLKDDIGKGDISAALIKDSKAVAMIMAKQPGILAGIDEIKSLYKQFRIKQEKKDGDKIKKGDIIMLIEGSLRKLLQYERTGINILQRMSGIATLVSDLNKKTCRKAKIAATRKTLWGLMDKKAVFIGKGLTHRLNLADAIMIKDNHLVAWDGDIEKALKLANKNKKAKFIDIEVKNDEEALKAAKAMKKLNIRNGVIMLDNLSPEKIKSIVKKIRKISKNIAIEASGGINPKNITKFANTGADVLSLGFITHSAKVLDISQEIIPK